MKVLQVISGRDVSGALVHCDLLSRQLVQAGHDVFVMCREPSWIWDRLEGSGVRRVTSNLNRWPPREVQQTASWIRKTGIDVIHTHMSRAHKFGIMMRYLTGSPCVATAHNRYVQLHWRLNDFVIANSDATRDFHLRVNRVSSGRIKTVHCFIDLQHAQPAGSERREAGRRALGVDSRQVVVGVVGEVIPRKGQLYLFRALPELLRRLPQLQLVVVGRSDKDLRYTRRLHRILDANQLAHKVRWLGRRDDVPLLLAGFDVCVVPSVEEPLGLVALESLATGTPVVASNTGGLPEVIEHGMSGLLVAPRSPAALVQGIHRALTDIELRRRVIVYGKQRVASQFSPRQLTRQVEDVYRFLGATQRAAA